MFSKVLVANRGAIACRIMRTLGRMGIASVAVYSEADRHSLHVSAADEAICIGTGSAADSYLRADRILDAARSTGAQAIHPGYGFLSENAEFAQACADAGIVFVGPTPEQMRKFGLKHTAREIAQTHSVPLLPGSKLLTDVWQARSEASRIGFPVMLKSTAGGGGIGMRLVADADDLVAAFVSVERLARANFNDVGIYLERYVEQARHIEVQIFGDGRGGVIALGERDCSVQRRHQKVIEETPAPHLAGATRRSLLDTAIRLGEGVQYASAGTVEFLLDDATGAFYFLEVNTRLQVEHGVTEEVTGIDLVQWMVQQAAGELPPLADLAVRPRGSAIQVRLYAENPSRDFQPCSGLLTEVAFPADVRVETWVETGSEVPVFYDPMLAKLIVKGATRSDALRKLQDALAHTRLAGIQTNLEYLREVIAGPIFATGRATTHYLQDFEFHNYSVEVLEPGVQSTIQDWPGRLGYWNVGVPPSGPMDALAFRLANRLVENSAGAAALECTVSGPALKFHCEAVIAVCGADMGATLDGVPIALWTTHAVKAGSVLELGTVRGAGLRTYLAVAGGFVVPDYLGSKATFTLGRFGGHAGRVLRTGDMLQLTLNASDLIAGESLAPALIPHYANEWDVAVLYGPHGAPDFFTASDIDTLFATQWEVHYNSSRTGVRLIGPKPQWARSDGGEAGLHPSNIHDNAYAIGALDFTGDMPVILGPDGPSLGGFVCPAVIVNAELWKLGQLKPGDQIRFHAVDRDWAAAAQSLAERTLETLIPPALPIAPTRSERMPRGSAILFRQAGNAQRPEVTYRQAGDRYLLVEYGPLKLDLSLRMRVHALMCRLEQDAVAGILELTPGIRSLQVHFDDAQLPLARLLDLLTSAEAKLPDVDAMQVPSRVVHLPLSWDDSATRLAIEKYSTTVRKDAPWCPSNIEFIRRINGLDSIGQVRDIVFGASYLVLGLGDVYLGAPVATPVDPRHRLVTTKYNPARTWTPENAVGIGGAYLCVYGMEGPGGYQFVGRTVQMWNPWRTTADFQPGKPWLLRFFDQIRFYPVREDELLRLREDFPLGRFRLRTEETHFNLAQHNQFLRENARSIAAFKRTQQAAFGAERKRWRIAGQAEPDSDVAGSAPESAIEPSLPLNMRRVNAHIAGNVWKVLVQIGDRVAAGDALVVLESMKMEISICAPWAGTVREVLCQEGRAVAAGQSVLVLEIEAASSDAARMSAEAAAI